MRKKLRSQRGDTLTETLAALLLVVLTMAFLATSLVTAARINAGVRQTDTALKYDDDEGEKKTLTITRQGGAATDLPVEKNVTVYETEGGYRYYTHE